jgi:hypothetical protein
MNGVNGGESLTATTCYISLNFSRWRATETCKFSVALRKATLLVQVRTLVVRTEWIYEMGVVSDFKKVIVLMLKWAEWEKCI